MKITEKDNSGITVFTLEGRIDSQGAVELENILMSAIAGGKNRMVLEMSGVQYLNSAGLRTLADVLTSNKEQGGDLRLVGINPKVRRVFQIIGFDKFFEMYADMDEAMADL